MIDSIEIDNGFSSFIFIFLKYNLECENCTHIAYTPSTIATTPIEQFPSIRWLCVPSIRLTQPTHDYNRSKKKTKPNNNKWNSSFFCFGCFCQKFRFARTRHSRTVAHFALASCALRSLSLIESRIKIVYPAANECYYTLLSSTNFCRFLWGCPKCVHRYWMHNDAMPSIFLFLYFSSDNIE